ncbi:unnamed protein product [Ascophyllum nodosum]
MIFIKMIRQPLRLILAPKAASEALQANARVRLPYRVVNVACSTIGRTSSDTAGTRAVDESDGREAAKRGRSQQLRAGLTNVLGCWDVSDSLDPRIVNILCRRSLSSQRRRPSSSAVARERRLKSDNEIRLENQRTAAESSSGSRWFSSDGGSGRGTSDNQDSEMSRSPPSLDKTAVGIAPSRKKAFMRARKAGVTWRLLEGGGVPRNLELNSHGSDDAPIEIDKTILEAVWEEEDDANEDEVEQALVQTDAELKSFASGGGDISPRTSNDGDIAGQPERAGEGDAGGLAAGAQDFMGSPGDDAAPPEWEERKEPRGKLHPVLGELVADLKYKRVYLTSAEALIKAPVWQKANTLFPVRAMGIAEAKYLQEEVVEGMPGIITLYKRPLQPITEQNQAYTLGIVDGQHRLGAMLLLADKGRWDRTKRNVVIEVFNTKTEEDVVHLFAEINRAEPMQVVEVPNEGPEQMKESVSKAVLQLNQMFPEAFGTKRARPPSVHATAFRENIIKSGLIERHQLFNPKLLLDYLLRVNEIISRREPKMWGNMVGKDEGKYPTKKALGNALRRAKRSKFYLGLDLSWMLA